MSVERVEAVVPELTIDTDPLAGLDESVILESEHVVSPLNAPADEARVLQHPDVLRRRGQRDRERRCELRDTQWTFTKGDKHLSSHGVA